MKRFLVSLFLLLALTPFSRDLNYMSQAGFDRWQKFQQAGSRTWSPR